MGKRRQAAKETSSCVRKHPAACVRKHPAAKSKARTSKNNREVDGNGELRRKKERKAEKALDVEKKNGKKATKSPSRASSASPPWSRRPQFDTWGLDFSKFPMGPSDRFGVLRCVEGFMDDIPWTWMDNLSDKFCSAGGLAMTSDYSGVGQHEMALRRIRGWLVDNRWQGHAPRLTLQRSCDILPHAREALLEAGTDDECVFGDMTKRMPIKLLEKVLLLRDKYREIQKQAMDTISADKKAITEAKHEAEEKYLTDVKELILAEKTDIHKQMSWCVRHDCMCLSHPLASHDQITMSVAGISCIDWSMRGRKMGSLGDGCLSWTCYMREVIHYQYDIVVLECTRCYQEADAIFMLGHLYVFEYCIFSPSEIGVPSERWRKYMVFLHRRGKVQWIPGQELNREKFLKTFGRKLACDGHVYMDHTPEHMVDEHIGALAARQGMPARDEHGRSWKARSVMTRLSRARLESYEELLDNYDEADQPPRFFVDESQKAAYGHMSECVPALTRKNRIWSLYYDRLMLNEERVEAMGIPAIHSESTLGLAAPWPRALKRFSEAHVNQLSGNSMQLAAISAVLIYTLSCTERQS